eukprot:TRINITY_DN28341_c0_g1_i1.p1 TRINITY_DN28341_c0_g1~~TRINITY_DN28341_c0_g1_i1.p1  ORF type:complete len:537 (+),score=180.62 TRINITY_DN28341_c0_g1_i1:82-1692(+)
MHSAGAGWVRLLTRREAALMVARLDLPAARTDTLAASATYLLEDTAVLRAPWVADVAKALVMELRRPQRTGELALEERAALAACIRKFTRAGDAPSRDLAKTSGAAALLGVLRPQRAVEDEVRWIALAADNADIERPTKPRPELPRHLERLLLDGEFRAGLSLLQCRAAWRALKDYPAAASALRAALLDRLTGLLETDWTVWGSLAEGEAQGWLRDAGFTTPPLVHAYLTTTPRLERGELMGLYRLSLDPTLRGWLLDDVAAAVRDRAPRLGDVRDVYLIAQGAPALPGALVQATLQGVVRGLSELRAQGSLEEALILACYVGLIHHAPPAPLPDPLRLLLQVVKEAAQGGAPPPGVPEYAAALVLAAAEGAGGTPMEYTCVHGAVYPRLRRRGGGEVTADMVLADGAAGGGAVRCLPARLLMKVSRDVAVDNAASLVAIAHCITAAEAHAPGLVDGLLPHLARADWLACPLTAQAYPAALAALPPKYARLVFHLHGFPTGRVAPAYGAFLNASCGRAGRMDAVLHHVVACRAAAA